MTSNVKTSIMAKRRLSLDVTSASRVNEMKPVMWTTQSSRELNLHRNGTGAQNANGSPALFTNGKPSRFARKKSKGSDSHVKQAKVNGRHVKPQRTVVELSCRERYLSWRYAMVLLLQTSFVVAIFLRNCLPMAMVCMVKPTSFSSSSASSSPSSQVTSNTTVEEMDQVGVVIREKRDVLVSGFYNDTVLLNDTQKQDTQYEFDWDSEVQGLILTSILFSTFLGPVLVEQIRPFLGNKLTLTVCNLASTLLTFLTPVAARISPYLLVATRIIQGITLGANVPIIGDSIAWWAPQAEKLTMTALSFAGVNVGGILASVLSGFLCSIPIDNGWPFIFYTFGALSLLWGVAWHVFSSQKPEDHPFISKKEKEYIVSQRIGMEAAAGGKREKPPYLKILTSVPVLAFLAAITCHIWANNVFFTYMPSYFNKALGFPIEQTGVLVSLVSASRMLGSFLWTFIGNKLMARLGTNRGKKVCVIIGLSLAAGFQMSVGFFDKSDKWVAFALLIVVMIGQAVGSSTLTAVPLDMAPRYAGFLTGLFVSFGSLVAISGPLLTAGLTKHGTIEEWRIIWLIMGTAFGASGLIFTIFGKAVLQPWAQANRTSIPHIVSPFVTMGRRFSAVMEAPPLTPATPINSNRLEFTLTVQASATTVLPTIATVNHQILDVGSLTAQERPQPELEENTSDKDVESVIMEEDEDEDEDNFHDGFENKAFDKEDEMLPRPFRKRAFSEFGLEVMKQEVKLEDEGGAYAVETHPSDDEMRSEVIRHEGEGDEYPTKPHISDAEEMSQEIRHEDGGGAYTKEPHPSNEESVGQELRHEDGDGTYTNEAYVSDEANESILEDDSPCYPGGKTGYPGSCACITTHDDCTVSAHRVREETENPASPNDNPSMDSECTRL